MIEALKYVQANGLRFAYVEEGTGPLVLLLHGFPDTPQTWDATRPALAKAGFRAVSPFTRGYAPTEIPSTDDYGSDTLGADALALIDALGEKECILVAHDWGAAAAYSAAGLAPDKIRLLVTVGIPHPASLRWTPRNLWAGRHFFTLKIPGASRRIAQGGLKDIDELVQRWSPAWKVPPDETSAVKRVFADFASLDASIGYYRCLTFSPPPGQRKPVRCPAVAFAGTDDTIDPSEYEHARSRYLGAYEVVKMPGGHFMHREHPAHFVRELLRVLAPYREGQSPQD
jgi:pimeloyl-ACP methyl ester carboxylesterase